MKKCLLICLFWFTVFFGSNAQSHESFTIVPNEFIVNVDNLIKWYEMSLSAWDKEMKKYDFQYKGGDSGTFTYSNKKSASSHKHFRIVKYIDKTKLSIFCNFERPTEFSRQIDSLYFHLESLYFKSEYAGAHFKYIRGSKVCVIDIYRDGDLEWVGIAYYKKE